MNSPLEIHEVRLRGLGGPAVCGVGSDRSSAPMTGITSRLTCSSPLSARSLRGEGPGEGRPADGTKP
jgi:hypothetical protein